MRFLLPVFILFSVFFTLKAQKNSGIELEIIQEFTLNQELGALRAVPVNISRTEKGLLLIYSADKEIDPFIEMFYPPTDPVKLALYSLDGELIWKKEMGPSSLNGVWFTPVYPFDLDNDGSDEIYYSTNIDPVHILSYNSYRLHAVDSRNGELIGQWPWKRYYWDETLSHTFRNFILGGYVNGEPVLVTAQGTYANMGLSGWTAGMEQKWELLITAEEPGPRGSHMSPVIDIDKDNKDEILWGERCINLEDGTYQWIADLEEYKGHSDVIQPTLNRETGKWSIFTCRESGDRGQIKPRVVMYDDKGERIWSDLEEGHMDMGWTAQVNTDSIKRLAYTMSRGGKKAGPEGFFRLDVKIYNYNADNGQRIELPFNPYNVVPVDPDGDGYHEFARCEGEQADRKIYDLAGTELAFLGENVYLALASKFMDLPGEQLLTYHPDGSIKIWGDKNAVDSETARQRYNNPYYRAAERLSAVGYNKINLGGL